MTKKDSQLKIAIFGTPSFTVTVCDELVKKGIIPSLVVTQPDKPAGRKMILTPPPMKLWAEKHGIKVLQPENIDQEFLTEFPELDNFDLFIVAAYGIIMPKKILILPKYGTLNIHPSLLPQWRGASPLQAALLNDEVTGVSIMLMDEKMDHGPILDQALTETDSWPVPLQDLNHITAIQGAQMIVALLPEYISGHIKPQQQEHEYATFTKKITKADGEIKLTDNSVTNYRKYCAYSGWPRTYFFTEDGKRIVITEASFENSKFEIKKIIPEGKKEVDYKTFLEK